LKESIAYTLGFIASVVVGLFALLWFLVGAKEGGDIGSDFLGWVFSIVLLFFWGLIFKNSETRYQKILSGTGVLYFTILSFFYSGVLFPNLWNHFKSPSMPEQARIENFKETQIVWPGFDAPAGIRIEFDLIHSASVTGVFTRPILWMGPQKERSDKSHYYDAFLNNKYFVVDQNLLDSDYQVIVRLEPVLNVSKAPRLNKSSSIKLAYELYPTTLAAQVDSSHLCIGNQSYGMIKDRKVEPIYNRGTRLNSVWIFLGSRELEVDMSPVLTAAVHEHSSLQNNPELWEKMHKQLEPNNLTQAGFQECELRNKRNRIIQSKCFCR